MLFRCSNRIFLFGFLAIIIACSSCKKKDDTQPELRIEFPLTGATYSVNDTIRIGVIASDNVNLESIQARLTSINGVSASTSDSEFPVGNSFDGVMEVIVEDKYLESGEYTLRVVATDGKNERHVFVRIYLVALPKERRSIIVVTGNDNATIHRIDSVGVISTLATLSHDASGICINNRDDQALVVGQNWV